MIDIATGYYPNGQEFQHPWQFWVMDNFLSQNVYDQLNQIKDTGNYELVDTSDGNRVTKINAIASKMHIRLRKNKLYAGIHQELENSVDHSLSKMFDKNQMLKWNKDTHYIFDLVKCEPKYVYPKHIDHIDKIVSIVVYLHPENADGTTLFDKEGNEYNVVWKQNRAFIFVTNAEARHKYINSFSSYRYSLNVYAVRGNWEFNVTSKV